MEKLFAITSGKGGVGKSTVAVGIASALAELGETVLLIDMDEGLRCLDLMLGLSEKIAFDLSDALVNRDVRGALYPVDKHKGLYLIPAPDDKGKIDPDLFGEFIREAAKSFDRIILDFPAGFDFTNYTVLPDSTVFLTVCNPDPISLRDAFAVGDKLFTLKKQQLRLIINRFSYDYIKKGIYGGIDNMIDTTAIRLLGIVPLDYNLPISACKGVVQKKGNAPKAFKRIAKRITGQAVPLPKPKKI